MMVWKTDTEVFVPLAEPTLTRHSRASFRTAGRHGMIEGMRESDIATFWPGGQPVDPPCP